MLGMKFLCNTIVTTLQRLPQKPCRTTTSLPVATQWLWVYAKGLSRMGLLKGLLTPHAARMPMVRMHLFACVAPRHMYAQQLCTTTPSHLRLEQASSVASIVTSAGMSSANQCMTLC